jgi:tripartite-type tricarboxylate transporter receptor subunit TctC
MTLATAAAAVVFAGAAHAQAYPTKPPEMVLGFPAGSSADVVARLLADGMSRNLGQTVTVMNKPGAGGAIAYRYEQSQKPDGYSMVFYSNSISTLYYSGMLPFDQKAFDPVARVTVELPVIAVKGDAPWNNLNDLMAYAKKNPGALRVGNSGLGSHTHITGAALFGEQSTEVTHVAFGSGQVITSLLGGHIDAVVQLPGALAEHVKVGKLKVLGTIGTVREPAFPNVLTAMEQGIPFQAELWRGIAVPKGTPRAVVARIEEAVKATVNSAEFKAQGEKLGFLPAFQPPADFARTVDTEHVALSKLMDKAGLKKPQP